MFWFKKVVTQFLYPVPLSLCFLLTGLYLLWWTRRQRAGKVLVSVGAAIYALLGLGFVSDALLAPLENRHPPLLDRDSIESTAGVPVSAIRWIVVLGGGHTSDAKLPVTSQLSASAVVRLAEAIRLHRYLPEAKIVLSGGRVLDPRPNAELMAELAGVFGVETHEMVVVPSARDTKDEARHLRPVLGSAPFLLVTSASHMSRAVALFRKQGLHPIPAPSDYWVRKKHRFEPEDFFPNDRGLRKARCAVHEALGILWAKLRDQI